MAKGCVYIAPSGTALPTDAITALDTAFNCVGYISEDGITNAADTDNTEVKDMGGVTVLKEISSYGETYQFAMLELNENSAKLRYGSENVTVNSDGSMRIDHAMPQSESFVVVIEILLTGNKVKRIIIADATVSEFGDITYSSGDTITYDVTLAANPSELLGGASSREYVASVATAAAQSGKSTKTAD